jgi:POT family proton-dependent oligopeptide transporter
MMAGKDQLESKASSQISENTWFGHPKGLFYLFFAELWERFSFYGMRALLTLYMVEKVFAAMANRDVSAAAIYASYGSLVYASAVIGGKVADAILGFRRSIIFGGFLMAIGQFILAFHQDENVVFFMGLSFIIVGNGFFKPNISSFVGTLYPQGDTRKDSGFTIFYMGINIGAFVAPLLCGWLASAYGWQYGFGIAGAGMFIGLLVFRFGIKNNVFEDKGLPSEPELLSKKYIGIQVKHLVFIIAILFIPLIAGLISAYEPVKFGKGLFGDSNMVNILFQVFGGVVLLYLIYIIWKSSVDERKKLVVALFLTVFMTIFWGFGELSGSIITLFAARNVNLFIVNAAQSNSIWPMFVILLALPTSYFWTWLSKRRLNPYTPYKFVYGMFFLGIAFLILSWSRGSADSAGKVPFMYLVILYLFITIGELFMSPVGLSKITDLSPKRYLGFLMGVWFLSSTYAFQIVGFIAKKLAIENSTEAESVQGFNSLQIYTEGFGTIACYAIGASFVILLLAPLLKKWMGKIH